MILEVHKDEVAGGHAAIARGYGVLTPSDSVEGIGRDVGKPFDRTINERIEDSR